MIQLLTFLKARLDQVDGERGATMVEYGLLIALVAVVVAVGATLLGTNLSSLFTSVANSL